MGKHSRRCLTRPFLGTQELVAEEDLLAVPARVELLQNSTAALRDAYYTMRMGSEAWTVVGKWVVRAAARTAAA